MGHCPRHIGLSYKEKNLLLFTINLGSVTVYDLNSSSRKRIPSHFQSPFSDTGLDYQVLNGKLYRRASKAIPMKLVVNGAEARNEVIWECHKELGHRGREATYRRVADRFWLEGIYEDCRAFCASCIQCQFRSKLRQEEALYPNWSMVYGSELVSTLSVRPLRMEKIIWLWHSATSLDTPRAEH